MNCVLKPVLCEQGEGRRRRFNGISTKKGVATMDVCGKNVLVGGRLLRIARLDGEGFSFFEDPEAAATALMKSRSHADLFTFVQKLSDRTPKYSYPMEWDNMAALRVSTFADWMANQIDFKARNKVRKAAKNGVVIRETPLDDDLLRGISAIYNETPIRQGRPFPHFGKDLASLWKMKTTFLDRSIFIGAFLDDTLIGFIKLVISEDNGQAGLMHIVSMVRHRDKAPTNALIARAVQSCAERGVPYLWYAKFSYGNKRRDSLADFKRNNGFEKVDLPRYYVPLTVAGRMALRLGLHRETADWVPERLIMTYRRCRAMWYARRFPGIENA